MKPYYEDDFATIYHGDAREVLPTGGDFDLVTFDPPYNVGKDYGVGSDARPSLEYEVWIDGLLRLAAKEGTHLAYFPGVVNVPACYGWLTEAGWALNRTLAWHKKEYAGDTFTSGPAMCWEPVLWATREGEDKAWNPVYGAWGRDLLVVNSTHGDPLRKLHPCPKPPEVLRWLIGLFCPEGGSVLDPTMGTGTALVAAKYLNRYALGIDSNEAYCEIAATRLSQGVFDFGAAPYLADVPVAEAFL